MYMFTLNIAEFQWSLLLQIMSIFGFNCCQCYVNNKQGDGKKCFFYKKQKQQAINYLFMAKNVKYTNKTFLRTTFHCSKVIFDYWHRCHTFVAV